MSTHSDHSPDPVAELLLYNEQHNDGSERTLAGPTLSDALPAALALAAFPNPAWAAMTMPVLTAL